MATPTLHGSIRPTGRSRKPDAALHPSKRGEPAKKDGDVEIIDIINSRLEGFGTQTQIHTTVGYIRKDLDDGKRTPGDAKLLQHILADYDLPREFELDKVVFGPLSGLSFTDRLISNYAHGALEAYRKTGPGKPEPICRDCAGAGHWSRDCPKAFE